MPPNRATKRAAVTGGALVVVLVLLVLTGNSLEDNDAYSSIAAALVAIGTAFTGIVLYLRREEPVPQVDRDAEALALELLAQWEPEVRHRRQRFGDSQVIPLSWAQTDGRLAADPAAVVGGDAPLGHVRLKLDGRLEGNPDRAGRRLARAFEQVPSKRLVVLGEPGAGKTFLAVMLTVGLLRDRDSNSPVPVFLSLSSWDPVADSLDDWIVRTLAAAYYGGRERIPRALLVRRLLLPVLDGLDELPEQVRRRAISRVNDTLDGDRPLVLTCRSVEYRDGLAGGAPVLLRAPVVEILPVATEQVLAQLQPWPGIGQHVERQPDGPVATALSTPLMLTLFVAAYKERDPRELLEFTNRHAVEDHLVDLLVDTAYPDGKARTWLTFLAEHLHRHGERDLAWWRLARRTLSPWAAPILGLVVGFVMYGILALFEKDGPFSAEFEATAMLVDPALVATIFAVVVASLWLAGGNREPGAERAEPGFARGLVTGALLVLVPGVPLLLLSDFNMRSSVAVTKTTVMMGALLALALVAGLAAGLHELLVARSSNVGRAGPAEFLRHDRRSALTSAAVTGLAVGVLGVLACTAGAALGGHLGQRIALAMGLDTVADMHLPPLQTHVPWSLEQHDLPYLVAASGLLALLVALAVLTTRAWTRFLVARVFLTAGGHLPLRAMRFLADARERGLLRGTGGVYQFWHIRLQERLVATAAQDTNPRRSRTRRRLIIGATVVVLVVPAAVVWSAEPPDCPETGWAGVDGRMKRVVDDELSGCLALLNPDEWHLLGDTDGISPMGPIMLGELSYRVSVVGDFHGMEPLRRQQILRGVAAAGRLKAQLAVAFVQTDTGSVTGKDANRLIFHFLDRGEEILAGEIRAVIVDTGESTLVAAFWPAGDVMVGSRGMDFRSRADEYQVRLLRGFLGERPVVPGDGDCTDRYKARSVDQNSFKADLRGVELDTRLLDRIADCKPSAVVVDESQLPRLRELPMVPRSLNFMYVKDDSARLVPDCEQALGAKRHPEELETCVATLAAADGFGIHLAPVEN